MPTTLNTTDALLPLCIDEEGLALTADGALSFGIELAGLEEQSLDAAQLEAAARAWAQACATLPVGTVVKKYDFFHLTPFSANTEAPQDLTPATQFFQEKTLARWQSAPQLQQKSVVVLHFFFLPPKSCSLLNPILPSDPPDVKRLLRHKKEAKSLLRRFLANLPSGYTKAVLTAEEYTHFVQQYGSLRFSSDVEDLDREIVSHPQAQVGDAHLKEIVLLRDNPTPSSHHQAPKSITGTFLQDLQLAWKVPHVLVTTLRICAEKKWEKHFEKTWNSYRFFAALFSKRCKELAEKQQHDLMELESELARQGDRLVDVDFRLWVWDNDPDQASALAEEALSRLGKRGIQAQLTGSRTVVHFAGTSPARCNAALYHWQPMPLETAGCYLLSQQPRKGDDSGIILADTHNNPLYYDPFKQGTTGSLDNAHAFIFGPTGSGKSFFNGKMIKDRYFNGETVIVIDAGGTYRNLFRALGGRYVEYSPEEPLQMNPFLVPLKGEKYEPDADKISFLTNFLGTIWKAGSLNPEEYAAIIELLTRYYAELKSGIPSLVGFCDWLKALELPEELVDFPKNKFLLAAKPFWQGKYRHFFHTDQHIDLSKERLLCFELERVQKDQRVFPLVVQAVFDVIFNIVSQQPEKRKYLDVEEAWAMLNNASQDYIEAFFRKGRKSNLSIRLITQSIDEIKGSSIAGPLKDNASTLILLYTEKASTRAAAAEFLGLNDFDKEKYNALKRYDSLEGGYRDLFIRQMDQSAVWRLSAAIFEHALLTSKPSERNAILQLVKADGRLTSALQAGDREAVSQCFQEGVCRWVQDEWLRTDPAYQQLWHKLQNLVTC